MLYHIPWDVKRGSIAPIKDQSSVAEDVHDGLPKLTVCTGQTNEYSNFSTAFLSHTFSFSMAFSKLPQNVSTHVFCTTSAFDFFKATTGTIV